jgi:cytochrome bd-type quinol oxidase subunit 2
VPIVTAVVAWLEWRSLNRADSETGPFIGAIALFALSYLGLGISLFPYVVPHRLTLWQGGIESFRTGVPADRHAVPAARRMRLGKTAPD